MLRRFALAALAAALLVSTLGTRGDVAAASLRTSLTVTLKADLTETVGLASSSAPALIASTLNLTSGTSSGQADVVWSDERTIAASTTEDLDLAGGGLEDAFGVAFAPARVKVLAIVASADNTNAVVFGGDANSVPILSTAATTHSIQPGGILVLASPGSGWTVTAATGDILQVANGGAGSTVTYSILVVGASS